MKVFVVACIAALVIAVGGAFLLDGYSRTAASTYSTGYVRL